MKKIASVLVASLIAVSSFASTPVPQDSTGKKMSKHQHHVRHHRKNKDTTQKM